MSGMIRLARVGLLGLMLLPSRCGDPLEQYDRVVAEARRCAPGQACAIAGGVPGCRCPVPVRAEAKADVDAAAARARCRQTERLYCPPLGNPHCESGTCAASLIER